jgi:ankyrin repeat protein
MRIQIEEKFVPGGLTYLMHCASKGTIECLQILLEFGANVNTRDSNNRTALHYACGAGRQEMVQALLQVTGIDTEVQTNDGLTPLMICV